MKPEIINGEMAFENSRINGEILIDRKNFQLSSIDKDRVIEMAWEDRTPFDAIEFQFGLNEADVKVLMKKELKFSSYRLWRERVEHCKTKHAKRRSKEIVKFKSNSQRIITTNKISKRK